MISFRYHVITIVAVFVALAVGVVLGGGPLSGGGNASARETDASGAQQARAALADSQAGLAFDDSVTRAVAPSVLRDKLRHRPVTLLELPGVDPDTVTAMGDLIEASGGSLAGTYAVSERLLDVGNKQLVDELGSQLLDGTDDLSVPDSANGYDRMGTLIARAVATSENTGSPVDATATGILSGLSTADLVKAEGDVAQRGSLVLVLTGPGDGTDEQRKGVGSVLTALVAAVDAGTDGLVVAGPAAAAGETGMLTAIRSSAPTAADVSTVDSVERSAGKMVAILALAEQAAGSAGQYGAVDAADGALPGAAGQ